MVTKRFNQLFTGLVGSFTRHQDVPRTPDDIAELGDARWELEQSRSAIAVERETIIASEIVQPYPPSRTSVSEADVARLRVLGSGFIPS